jgi:hypothetical protein
MAGNRVSGRFDNRKNSSTRYDYSDDYDNNTEKRQGGYDLHNINLFQR